MSVLGLQDTQHNYIQHIDTYNLFETLSIECHYTMSYAKCRALFTVVLNVTMLSVILLNEAIPSVMVSC